MAHIIKYYNKSCAEDNNNNKSGLQFAQTHSIKKGLKKFGEKGQADALEEMAQLRRYIAFEAIDMSTLSQIERQNL